MHSLPCTVVMCSNEDTFVDEVGLFAVVWKPAAPLFPRSNQLRVIASRPLRSTRARPSFTIVEHATAQNTRRVTRREPARQGYHILPARPSVVVFDNPVLPNLPSSFAETGLGY